MRNSILLILVLWCICSCSRHNDVSGRLQLAETLIWTYPDSVQSLLEAIPHPEELQGKERADYALWLSLSKYRNNIQADSDSLINIAIDYYKGKSDANRIGTAWYTKAGILEERFENKEQAILAYKEAESFIPQMTDFKAVCRIYGSLAYWNMKFGNYSLAKEYNLKTVTINKNLKDTISYAQSLLNLTSIWLYLEQQDSVNICIKRLTDIVKNINDSTLCSKICNNIGLWQYESEDYDKAEYYFTQALCYSRNNPSYKTLANLAKLYTQTERNELADSLYQQALQTNNMATRSVIYKNLYKKAWENQQYDKANKYINEYEKAINNYYEGIQEQNIQTIQAEYDHLVLLHENIKIKDYWLQTVIAALIVIIITIVSIFYLREKNRRTTLKLGKLLEELILKDEHQQTLSKEIQDLVTQKQKIEKSINQYRLIYGHSGTVTKEDISFWQSIQHLTKGNDYQPEKDREHLIRFLNMFKNGFADKLHTNYPMLQKRMLDVCYLAAFGFPIERIAKSLNVEVRTVERYMFNICQETNFSQKGKKGFKYFIDSIS